MARKEPSSVPARKAKSGDSIAQRIGDSVDFTMDPEGNIRFKPWVEETQGILLDQIILGPTRAAGNKFPISSFDAKIVPGDKPSACPHADRKVPAEFLPTIESVFKRCGYLKPGHTIHWTGSQSKLENLCLCYRDDLKTKQSLPKVVLANEARDKWLYDQCVKGVKYSTIERWMTSHERGFLAGWKIIKGANSIKAAATRYAKRQDPELPPIPLRQHGIKSRKAR